MLLSRAVESALSPGTVSVKGEHPLQVLKHVIKESSAKAPLLKLPLLSVHSLLMGLEVAVKVSLLVGLILGVGMRMGMSVSMSMSLGVKVVLVSVWLTKVVKVFEDVIEVEGLEVLVEVVFASASSSSMALPW